MADEFGKLVHIQLLERHAAANQPKASAAPPMMAGIPVDVNGNRPNPKAKAVGTAPVL